MCAGAIVHCRPARVVIGCADPKSGAAGGWINLLDSSPPLNHRCEVEVGVLGDESLALLQRFFREARDRKAEGRSARPVIGFSNGIRPQGGDAREEA